MLWIATIQLIEGWVMQPVYCTTYKFQILVIVFVVWLQDEGAITPFFSPTPNHRQFQKKIQPMSEAGCAPNQWPKLAVDCTIGISLSGAGTAGPHPSLQVLQHPHHQFEYQWHSAGDAWRGWWCGVGRFGHSPLPPPGTVWGWVGVGGLSTPPSATSRVPVLLGEGVFGWEHVGIRMKVVMIYHVWF